MIKSLAQRALESGFFGGSASYMESLYEDFLNDPKAVPEQWRKRFDELARAGSIKDRSHADIRESVLQSSRSKVRPAAKDGSFDPGSAEKQAVLNIAPLCGSELSFDAELACLGVTILESAVGQTLQFARTLGALGIGLGLELVLFAQIALQPRRHYGACR